MHSIATIGALTLAAFLGVVHVVIHRSLWQFTRVNHLLGWLMRKVPLETQPMAAFLIGRKAAFAGFLFAASMVADGWINWLAGGIAILVAIWTLRFILYRYRSPWRRLYFGFMDLYSGMASMHEAVEAMTQGSMPFDQIKPLAASLRKALPDLTNNEAEERIVRWKREADNREITELLRNVYRKLHPSANDLETNQAVDEINNEMLSTEHYPSYLLRYVIGKIIEYKAGLFQTEAYWQAVMTRKVS